MSSPVQSVPASHLETHKQRLPQVAMAALIALCAAKLLFHIFTSVRHYGYFRDELYYLDMARHLDWGYVDAAPLIAVYAKLALLLGGSLAALRILPALAGTALIALTMLIARELGGNRYSQTLAGLAILLAPGVLAMNNFLSMNAFEPLYWMGCIWVVARIVRTGDSRLWLWFGVLAGLGLENKHSTFFFGFAVTVALLLSAYRREFLKPWIWIAGGIAMVLFLPNLIWQIRHHFPTLEDLENVRREGKNVILPPLAFLKEQFFDMGPVLCPIWLAGLIWFLREQRWRVLGFTFLVFYIAMEIEGAKNYYLFPIYPMLFAGGAVAIERALRPRARWLKYALALLLIAGSLPIMPLFTAMLSPEQYIAYEDRLGIRLSKAEVKHSGPLPQPMGDQFGWPELVRDVATAYNSVPPEERPLTGIWAGNYGEAGAVNLFGPQYGLPHAYSRHQTHWYWGPPPVVYKNLIVIQWSLDDVKDNCTSYETFPHTSQWGMEEENTPLYLCRGVKFDIQKIWSHNHHWN